MCRVEWQSNEHQSCEHTGCSNGPYGNHAHTSHKFSLPSFSLPPSLPMLGFSKMSITMLQPLLFLFMFLLSLSMNLIDCLQRWQGTTRYPVVLCREKERVHCKYEKEMWDNCFKLYEQFHTYIHTYIHVLSTTNGRLSDGYWRMTVAFKCVCICVCDLSSLLNIL